jgi:PAS domain S-box-containing protein
MALLLLGVIVANAIGGFRAGLIAAAISLVGMDYFFVPPLRSFAMHGDAVPVFVELTLILTVLGLMHMLRVRREQRLRASRDEVGARDTAILDSALDCIICMDADGCITEFNPAAERTFGYQRADVVGRRLADVIVPAALREAHRIGMARYLASGEERVLGRRIEMTGVRRDGSEFPVELAITRVPMRGPPCFTGYLRDISDRKRAEDAQTRRARDMALRAEISAVLARTDTMRAQLEACAAVMVRHLDVAFARIWTLARGSAVLDLQASAGPSMSLDVHPRIPLGDLEIDRVAHGRAPYVTDHVAAYPLLVGTRSVGALAVFSRQPMAADTADTLASVAEAIAQRIERRRADDELRRSEAYLAEGQRLSHTGSWAWHVHSGERFWSREVFRIYGFEPAESPPAPDVVRQRVHPKDRLAVDAVLERAIRDRAEVDIDSRLIMQDGAVRYLHTVGHPVLNEAGELIELRGTVVDVTARKIAEQRLRHAIRGRYRAVLSERTRVAREMHDGLLQDAMGIALHLRAVLPDVRHASEAAASALLPVVELAEKTTDDARQAIMGMRRRATDEDIVGAVERAARRGAAQSPVALSISVTGRSRFIPPSVQHAVVRIVQEATTNVARHAGARTLTLAVAFRLRWLRVVIADDGRGFDPEGTVNASNGHFGLVGMRERAKEVRGSLDVQSMPGAGTTVMLRVPYRARIAPHSFEQLPPGPADRAFME